MCILYHYLLLHSPTTNSLNCKQLMQILNLGNSWIICSNWSICDSCCAHKMLQEWKIFLAKSKHFCIKMQHQDKEAWTIRTKKGAQSIKVEFAPAADVWWVLLPALVLWCKPVPMNIFAARRPTYPAQLFITRSLSQPKRNQRIQGLTCKSCR